MARKKKTVKKSDQSDAYLLRMPKGLREDVAVEAKQAGRSMNAQIVYYIQQALIEKDTQSQAELEQKVDKMEGLVYNIARSLNNLYEKSIEEVESMDPSEIDNYPDELDPKDIEEKLKSLKENLIPVKEKSK